MQASKKKACFAALRGVFGWGGAKYIFRKIKALAGFRMPIGRVAGFAL